MHNSGGNDAAQRTVRTTFPENCIFSRPPKMARPPQITRANLAPLMMLGPVSAVDMAARLRVNRTTIVRGLADMGDEVVSMGATRRTRYALRRSIRNAGNRWPIYVMDEAGRARPWAELEALYERRWRIRWLGEPPAWAHCFSDPEGLWEGFPFFLGGARPQGFLGRAIARQISRALALPEEPRTWSDDHILIYLQAASEDLPGNHVVGDECLRRALARAVFPDAETVVPEAERSVRYPAMAQMAASSLPGTSAGGEQPKFLTSLHDAQDAASAHHPVLVKFTAPMDQPTGQRWADLLLCEYHAHEVLAECGLATPGARILDAAGRRFLEVPRFDRVGTGGRRGVASLESLHASVNGFDGGGWPQAAEELQRQGLIDAEAVATVRRMHAFGELIGNTDMHAGNLSFWLDDTLPFRVAPTYDMLPMLWAPVLQGEITPRTFAPAPPLPAALDAWREAAVWAAAFWDRVAAEPRLSEEFQGFVRDASRTLGHLRAHVG